MKDLVEQMRKAWEAEMEANDFSSNLTPAYSAIVNGAMTAAAKVCLAALGEPTDAELDAVEHSWIFDKLPEGIRYRPSDVAQKVRDAACIFNANRRALLLAPKTVEERVTVGMDHNGWFVARDGVVLQDKLKEGIAKAARRGLIAEIKEREG